MRLLSNRQRTFDLGPYPMERLRRSASWQRPFAAATGSAPDAGGTADPQSVDHSIDVYQRLFGQFRDGSVAARKAEIEADPKRFAANLKATCYFLDASAVGICRVPAEAWTSAGAHETPLRHPFAIAIALEYARDPKPDEPGAAWIRGTQIARARLKAAEVAIVLAGYIRRLGYSARAHIEGESDLDHRMLLAAAGVARWDRAAGRMVNPFMGSRFGTAAVSTDMPLEPDRALAHAPLRDWLAAKGPSYWLGLGGSRTALEQRRAARRPLHLGPYPMERIKRRDTTTTLITDRVARVPRRAGFFVRAELGDLGTKAKTEMTRARFALKHPLASAMAPLMLSMATLQAGDTAAEVAPGTADAHANTDAIKALSYYLGADMVGICAAPDYVWYSHRQSGDAIDPYHRYAVVMLIDQGHDTMEGSSGDDWISGAQSMRSYMRGEEIGGIVAHHVRRLGHSARSQTNQDSDVLHVPLILLAGLGELSRIGELVLNPFVGPRFKSVIVTTDMPLVPDRPIDFGLQDFCSKCVKCARECPCDAIPYGGKIMFNGYETWKPDVERCVRYRLTNARGSACGRCMKMCPYNTEGLLAHRAVLWAAIRLRWTRAWIARYDDKIGRGRRNPVKRWWFDLEMVGDVAVRPQGVNERDLDLAKVVDPAKQKLALYTPDLNPRPDQLDTVPVARKLALQRAREVETPEQARTRLR